MVVFVIRVDASVGYTEPFNHPPQKEATRTSEHCAILGLCSTVYGGRLPILVVVEDSADAPSLVATTTGDDESHDFVEHAPRPNVVFTLTTVRLGVTGVCEDVDAPPQKEHICHRYCQQAE